MPTRPSSVRNEVAAATQSDAVHDLVADLSELDAVRRRRRRAARPLRPTRRRDPQRRRPPRHAADDRDGIEATVAVQVVAPFLLTSLLLERLRRSRPGRVLTMSSGGMYTAPLTVAELGDGRRRLPRHRPVRPGQAGPGDAQRDVGRRSSIRHDVVFHAVHPGWADTPGVESSLPRFRRLDGAVAAQRRPGCRHDRLAGRRRRPSRLSSSGGFWHDRRRRDDPSPRPHAAQRHRRTTAERCGRGASSAAASIPLPSLTRAVIRRGRRSELTGVDASRSRLR